MDHGVGRHVASHLWGVIALPNSGPAMGKLMQDDGNDHRNHHATEIKLRLRFKCPLDEQRCNHALRIV